MSAVVRTGQPALGSRLRSTVASCRAGTGSPRMAVAVFVLVALVGAGTGAFGPLDSDAGGDAVLGSTTPVNRTPTTTPAPPPSVTATPPTPTADGSGTPAAPASDGRRSVDVSVADPDDVHQRDGLPTTVSASLGGNVSTAGSADSVVVVVQSWVLGHGWAEVARASRPTGDTASLQELFGEVTLAAGDRAAGFDNPHDGTTVRHRGRVSVTAVLFDEGREVGRVSATDDYTLRVTNLAAPETDLVLGDGGATGSLFGPDGLSSGDDTAGANAGVVAPGSTGTNTLRVTNGGSEPGTLTLSTVSYVSFENGLTGPESAVDDTGGDPGRGAGELHEALELRLALERGDGSRVWVFGNETTFGSIDALAAEPLGLGALAPGEQVELVVEYRLPASVGNEIQTDSIVVDASFTLSAD